MPSATASSHYQSLLRCADDAKYLWKTSEDGSVSSRTLSYSERVFAIFNQDLYGQNCPYIGASLTIKNDSAASQPFSLSELEQRATKAFIHTRWTYPTVAARIDNGQTAIYDIKDFPGVAAWAKRTVKVVEAEGGWLALREHLSRTTALPSEDGDYCLVYVIVPPKEAKSGTFKNLDTLIHLHHTFTDGSAIRVILNEFLDRFSAPHADSQICWGEEIERLLPPSILLEKKDPPKHVSENAPDAFFPKSKNLGPFFVGDRPNEDVGLPIYRPDIQIPTPDIRGTQLITHTFPSTFLPSLLSIGRAHGVKLASVLHAALLKAVYITADPKPKADDVYISGSAMDLRNGYLLPEYYKGKKYVNSAATLHPFTLPCRLFSDGGEFWKAAQYVREEWAGILKRTRLTEDLEENAVEFISNYEKQKNEPAKQPPKPRTCPYFVSDPPGSLLLSKSYRIQDGVYEGLEMVLENYQLATDQTGTVVSARSHSWDDKLTLCLVFNAIRNPKDKMQVFLDRWVKIVENVREEKYL